MARKPGSAAAVPPARNLNRVLRHALTTCLMLAGAVGALVAYQVAEQFLVGDARFRLAGPGEEGEESGSIRLYGVDHSPRARLLGVFDRDYDRSVYLLPLAERRRQLLAVEWVKDASLRRAWPNRLEVYLSERQPVAFVQVPASDDGAQRIALIDAEGVILDPPPRARYRLPVLAGIRPDQSQSARRDGVRRMQRLLAEIGALAERISEIDVTHPDNLKVVEYLDGRAVTLLVGNRLFRQRLEKFHASYPEIRGQLNPGEMLDLRIENRIFSVKGAADAQ
ncbi:MAG: FtsQ-type POTRA domain-containing protein [Acidobacteria bacterium]|nr:FtsQ-type POTRA domain-containing protein [Acidobacteriota bacterium]